MIINSTSKKKDHIGLQGLPIQLAAKSRSAAGKLMFLIPFTTSAKNGGNGVTRWHHTR